MKRSGSYRVSERARAWEAARREHALELEFAVNDLRAGRITTRQYDRIHERLARAMRAAEWFFEREQRLSSRSR